MAYAVVAVHALVFAALIVQVSQTPAARLSGNDAVRYDEIARQLNTGHGGAIEYPPGAALLIRAIAGDGVHPTLRWLALINALADLALLVMLWRWWSRSAAMWFAVLTMPMLAFLANGYDLVVVALAVMGIGFAKSDRSVRSGMAFAVAAMFKLWPAVLILGLWAQGRRRSAATAFAATTAFVSAWIWRDGWVGVADVLTFRGARGWHVESVPGAVLAFFTGAHSRFEAGSWRVGAPPTIATAMLAAALVATFVVAFEVTRRISQRSSNAGLPEDAQVAFDGTVPVVLIGATMIFATLLSPQYIAWLFPFVAIAISQGSRTLRIPAIAVVALNTLYLSAQDLTHPDHVWMRLEVIARNLCLVWLVGQCAYDLYCAAHARATSPATSENESPLTSMITSSIVPVNAKGDS